MAAPFCVDNGMRDNGVVLSKGLSILDFAVNESVHDGK